VPDAVVTVRVTGEPPACALLADREIDAPGGPPDVLRLIVPM
jgi:hypothetical protein